jgi:hypothetical protein
LAVAAVAVAEEGAAVAAVVSAAAAVVAVASAAAAECGLGPRRVSTGAPWEVEALRLLGAMAAGVGSEDLEVLAASAGSENLEALAVSVALVVSAA